MKKEIKVEKTLCDFCGKEASYKCLGCGMDICYECKTTRAKEYRFSVYFTGQDDGLYCSECDNELRKSNPKDGLYAAYVSIERLRNEHAGWYKNFKERTQEAENNLNKLLRDKR